MVSESLTDAKAVADPDVLAAAQDLIDQVRAVRGGQHVVQQVSGSSNVALAAGSGSASVNVVPPGIDPATESDMNEPDAPPSTGVDQQVTVTNSEAVAIAAAGATATVNIYGSPPPIDQVAKMRDDVAFAISRLDSRNVLHAGSSGLYLNLIPGSRTAR